MLIKFACTLSAGVSRSLRFAPAHSQLHMVHRSRKTDVQAQCGSEGRAPWMGHHIADGQGARARWEEGVGPPGPLLACFLRCNLHWCIKKSALKVHPKQGGWGWARQGWWYSMRCAECVREVVGRHRGKGGEEGEGKGRWRRACVVACRHLRRVARLHGCVEKKPRWVHAHGCVWAHRWGIC